MPADIDAIAWDESYAIGDPSVDDQHRRLFAIYNEMIRSLAPGGVDAQGCALALRELADYARHHFHTEETLMRALHFPRLAEHAREHREFTRILHALSERAHQDSTLLHDVARFVRQWILNHVLHSDGLIRQYTIHGRQPL